MHINIQNVRFGFATNSSSSHSIILLRNGAEIPKAFEKHDSGFEFGWDHFVCDTTESKMRYFAALVYENLSREIHPSYALRLAKDICGVTITDGYIDHQSVITLPKEHGFGDYRLNEKFMAEFLEFLLRKDVVILGGNDNEIESPKEDIDGKIVSNLFKDSADNSVVARKDKNYGYWTLFDRNTGTKIRMSFSDGEIPNKASSPELVDMKITDYCPFGCSFCYQASTTAGNHAKDGEVRQILHILAESGVFEVAFGGGEPTMHPEFLDILETARHDGIVPSFTTKASEWMFIKPEIWKLVGGVGCSVSSYKDAQKLIDAVNKLKEDYKDKIVVQIVMGILNYEEYRLISNILSMNYLTKVLLLDWKDVGFASGQVPKDYSFTPELIDRMIVDNLTVSVDTPLAARFEEEIKKRNFSPFTYSVVEGTHSCYIDAVQMTVAKSSYCKPGDAIPFKKHNQINADWLNEAMCKVLVK